VAGIDDECLTAETLDSYTKRIAAAFRGFSERFRIYQYIVKQDRAQIEQQTSFHSEAVRQTVQNRREHLQSKPSGLYTLDLYFVILYEPAGISDGAIKQASRGLTKRNFSTKAVLRVAAHELAQSRDALMGQAISLQRTIGDLLGLQMLGKREVFSFFRLLCNLDPQLASNAQRLRLNNETFWVLGCQSAGDQADAGTMYPTLIEDSNGNQISLAYAAGVGQGSINTSARLTTVQDGRPGVNPAGAPTWAKPNIVVTGAICNRLNKRGAENGDSSRKGNSRMLRP